jgi:hypothetical protein
MTQYKVSFYTKHNPGMQFEMIKANSKAEVKSIYEANACEVISVDEIRICVCLEIVGDNGDCPVHGAFSDDEIKADYQERGDLYSMGMGY